MPSYINPLGSWAQGYGQGVEQENALQQGVRKARAEDYDYRVDSPLRTQALQLGNDYSNRTLDTRVQGADEGLQALMADRRSKQLGLASDFAQTTGNVQPVYDFAAAYGPNYGPVSQAYVQQSVDFPRFVQGATLRNATDYQTALGQGATGRADAALLRAQTAANGATQAPLVGTARLFQQPGAVAAQPAAAPAQVGLGAPQVAAAQEWLDAMQQDGTRFDQYSPEHQQQIAAGLSVHAGIPLEQAYGLLIPGTPEPQQNFVDQFGTTAYPGQEQPMQSAANLYQPTAQ